MQQTQLGPGVYIEPATLKVQRVENGAELDGVEGHWQLLAADLDAGLLACREAAVAKGFAEEPKAVDWYVPEAVEPTEVEPIEELNKARAKAEAEAAAERERTGNATQILR